MYWGYVLICVEDLMVASRRASSAMEAISHVYTLKGDKKTKKCFGPPDIVGLPWKSDGRSTDAPVNVSEGSSV